MAECCTLFGSLDERGAVLDLLRGESGAELDVSGAEGAWSRVRLRGRRATLVFTSLVGEEPAGRFERLVQDARGYFAAIPTRHVLRRDMILDHLAGCRLILGVVAEPEFDEEEGHFDWLWAIAEATDSLIFNGAGMVDAQGKLLLGADGGSEE